MESKEKRDKNQEEKVKKIILLQDFQQQLARLSSLSFALHEANQRKSLIQQKLNSLLHLEAESLKWSNELDEMREKLESRKLGMGNMSMRSKTVRGKGKKQEEELHSEIRSLLMAGSVLSVASKRLQEANKSLAGERGHVHLQNLQKLLRVQQQFMVSQISLLYTYHMSVHPFTKMKFFTNRKEALRSATALGYVAHAVSLIATYIKVPLRYPIRLGGSRTYICDYAPSVESLSKLTSTSMKPMEFPLFLEGKETTRSSYAVFLLNKDLEQLLNFIGNKSLGPRHVLANFKKLLNNILSREYIKM